MNIGIIGLGIVGEAHKYGFEKLGHKVFIHDIKLNTKIQDILNTRICYVCVPTPSNPDGSCNTSIVESVVKEIRDLNYGGVICIKSTIEPGTTQKLIQKYGYNICYSIETLRERSNTLDFVENMNLLLVGTSVKKNYDLIVESHKSIPKKTMMVSPTEAEIAKYMHNAVNSLRVVFANEFYEICQVMGVDYQNVKQALLETTGLPNQYLDVSEYFRGYSSICFNKDNPAIIKLSEKLGLNLKLLKMIPEANNEFKKTPIKGTRI